MASDIEGGELGLATNNIKTLISAIGSVSCLQFLKIDLEIFHCCFLNLFTCNLDEFITYTFILGKNLAILLNLTFEPECITD